jgi:hypothetical protein
MPGLSVFRTALTSTRHLHPRVRAPRPDLRRGGAAVKLSVRAVYVLVPGLEEPGRPVVLETSLLQDYWLGATPVARLIFVE